MHLKGSKPGEPGRSQNFLSLPCPSSTGGKKSERPGRGQNVISKSVLELKHLATITQAKDPFFPYDSKPEIFSLTFSAKEIGLGQFVWHSTLEDCKCNVTPALPLDVSYKQLHKVEKNSRIF